MTPPLDHTIWRLEALPRPTEAHAADAVEMVAGEIVRRISLPKLDYAVLQAYQQNPAPPGPDPLALAACVGASISEIRSAIRRLAAVGLIPLHGDATLQ